jgi:tRNA A-37 threonylcarbamoyl transferase component Bud32
MARPGQFFKHSPWVVEVQGLHPGEQATFHSITTLQQSTMAPITLDSRSGVSRLDLENTYYVKTFKGAGSRIKFWFNASRYQRELNNLRYFNSLGLETPTLIAYGHQTHLGVLQQAVLVTAEVADATDLEQIARSGDLYRKGVPAAQEILSELASATRAMHADGFYHKDLKPRNILVRQTGDDTELFFFDCPSGHHPPRLLLRRGIVRDLAHLEEGLRGHVRRVDLLYMYKIYRSCDKLGDDDKALARDALSYYTNRRMTRKRRQRKTRKNLPRP